MAPMLIYVASPYSADTEAARVANVERSMRAGYRILDLGHYPLMPLLTHFFEAYCVTAVGCGLDYETYMAWDIAMLRRCDGLLYLGSSPGADRELALAEELGMTVWNDERMIPEAAS